jgi:hypothetical protein
MGVTGRTGGKAAEHRAGQRLEGMGHPVVVRRGEVLGNAALDRQRLLSGGRGRRDFDGVVPCSVVGVGAGARADRGADGLQVDRSGAPEVWPGTVPRGTASSSRGT